MYGQEKKCNFDSLELSVKEYVNLRVDEYKYKGVENFSQLSNWALVALVSVMLGVVILQLAGFAIAFTIGELVGSTAMGFGAMALFFILALLVVYIRRESLFKEMMLKMYSKMFFGSEIADLKGAQQENTYKIKMKEMEFGAYVESLKDYLNPLTYINYAMSKLAAVENLAAAFFKGYSTISEMVSNLRNRSRRGNDVPPDNNGED